MKTKKIHDTDCNLNIQELIRVAMQSKPGSTRNVTDKMNILKTLFLTREHMSDKNPIKHNLAFYWYKDGPYSEIVVNNLEMLVDAQKVIKSKTDTWEMYKLVPEYALRPIVQYDAFMDEAASEVKSIVSESTTNVHDLILQMYKTAAPTPLYISYKLEFMPKFENHCKDMQKGRENKYTPRQILELLDDVVLDFPTALEFLGIRMIFMDFAKILNAFLRWDEYYTHNDLLNELLIMCNDIWETFAYGARVHYHDSYYKPHMDDWKRKYEQKLHKLNCTTLERVKKFDSIVVDDMPLAPDIEDMVLHPELYTFKPLEMDVVADTR